MDFNAGPASPVQATEVQYAFHSLGWYQFQELAAAVLSDVLGQSYQTFEPGNDRGRDGAFRGAWTPHGAETHSGTFTFQVKYTRRPGKQLTLSVLRQELAKAKALVKEGLADHYYVITNCAVTFERATQLEREIKARIGSQTVTIFGANWLTRQIRASKSLRALVPRVYGLGDISEIIDERAYEQARAVIESLGARLATFVPTAAYHRALDTLSRNHFVFIVGDAMTGKTTLAYELALGALDRHKSRVLKLRDAEALERHLNVVKGGAQFIWVDDAFGETQFDPALAASWSRHVDLIHAAIDRGAQLVFTSRGYIWRAAQDAIKRYSFLGFDEHQVVIELTELTERERQQMLYHHVRMGAQTYNFKSSVKKHLADVAKLPSFLPEAARRLGNPTFTRSLVADAAGLQHFFEKPLQILTDLLVGLDASSKAALALIFSHGGSLQEPFVLADADRNTIERFGARPESVFPALEAMRESLVRVEADLQSGAHRWAFAHPTIRDAFAELTAGTTMWLRIYLAGADVRHIIGEAYCGRLPQDSGARVVVPIDAYRDLVSRLHSYVAADTTSANRDAVQLFLTTRCSDQFLAIVSTEAPSLFEPGQFGYYQVALDDPWLRFAERLAGTSLLTGEMREAAVSRMEEYAPYDLSFLESDSLRELFSSEEYSDLQRQLAHKLEERLQDQIRQCVVDCTAMAAYYSQRVTDRILERFRPLLEYFEMLSAELDDQPEFLEVVEEAREAAIAAEAQLVGQNEDEYGDEPDITIEPSAVDSGDKRDVFRDVADNPERGDEHGEEPEDDDSDEDLSFADDSVSDGLELDEDFEFGDLDS